MQHRQRGVLQNASVKEWLTSKRGSSSRDDYTDVKGRRKKCVCFLGGRTGHGCRVNGTHATHGDKAPPREPLRAAIRRVAYLEGEKPGNTAIAEKAQFQ